MHTVESEYGWKRGQAAIFDSLEDMRAWLGKTYTRAGADADRQSRHYLSQGHAGLAAKAETMLELIEATSLMGACAFETSRCVAGALPDVPAYLAGSPMSMRRRTRTRQAAMPLHIVVECFIYGGVGDDGRTRRGAAIAALVRRLEQAGHALDLWCGHTSSPDGKATGTALVRMETKPLDLARVAYVMVSSISGYKAQSFEAIARVTGRDGGFYAPWSKPEFSTDVTQLAPYYAELLHVEPSGVLAIPGLSNSLANFSTSEKAAAWVSAQYARAVQLSTQQEE